MPKIYKRRTNRKKLPWYSKKYSAVQLARKAWSAAKYVKSLVNVEKKFCDVTSSTSVSNAGTIIPLNTLTKGDNYNNRQGNSIKASSILIRVLFTLSSASTVPTNTLRIILVRDNEVNGASPGVTGILESASVNSPINHSYGKRFTILRDKVMTLSLNGSEGRPFKMYMKLGQHIHYNDTNNGDVTDFREGGLFLLLLSDVATNQPTAAYYSRIRFIDN